LYSSDSMFVYTISVESACNFPSATATDFYLKKKRIINSRDVTP